MWEECNSDTDCCGPATCQGNEWYMQCEPSSPTSVPTLRPTSGPTPGLTSAPSSNPSGLPTLAPTEVSPFPLLGVRTIDGTDREDDLGASHETLMRMALTPEMGYIDAVGDMNHLLPNPRNISNMVSAQRSTSTNARGMSDMIWSWGQFIDHGKALLCVKNFICCKKVCSLILPISFTTTDIGLTQHGDSFGSADVTIPQSDSNDVFVQAGCTDISFGRSQFEGGGTSIRSQVNMITSFLDASMVYGSDYDRANYLRTMTDGLLKTSDNGRMLPFNDGNFHNEGGDGDTNLYLAGDVRANEQAGLTAMHTLFVREHNRLAGIIKEKYPAASDEDIYQLARKIVGAEIQIITYKEFLPALMGPNAPNPDDENLEFDARVSPSVANEFSAFAFRFGHSMLSSSLKLADADGEIGTVLLRNIFFNPDFFKTAERGSTNVDHLLLGFLRQHAQEIDTQIVDDVRNFLFSTPAGPGTCLDLAVLNIQRGRDHGLLNCNMFREQMGLGRHYSFASVTSDEELQIKLSLAYNGQVDDIDAWVCALAEDHVDGASIGPLLMYVLHDQFYRLMVGDPFFYKWDADLEAVQQTGLWDEGQVSLATVIQQNTIGNPTGNAFFV